MVDSRFRPQCAAHNEYLLVFIVEQNLVGISAVVIVVFYRRLEIHVTRYEAIVRLYDATHKTGST